MFSHLPQVELFHMLPTTSPSLCPQTTPLQLTLSVWLLLPSPQASHQYSWKNSLSSPCAQDHGNRASGHCWGVANPTFDFNSLPTCWREGDLVCDNSQGVPGTGYPQCPNASVGPQLLPFPSSLYLRFKVLLRRNLEERIVSECEEFITFLDTSSSNNWWFARECVSDHSNVIWFRGGRNHGCFSEIPGSFPNAFMSFISMDTCRDMRESGGSVCDFNLSDPMCLWPWVGLAYTYVG